MKFKACKILAVLLCLLLVGGCSKPEKKVITLAAAVSLEKIFTRELIPLFRQQHPDIEIEGTYSGSGNLQLQIEQGLPADIFISASPKQVEALAAKGLVDKQSVVKLLENKLVLIVPQGSDKGFKHFKDIAHSVRPALGNFKSVPAGQYAYEALSNLQILDIVSQRASFANGVTEVLHWVAEGSADAGIVYATDARTTDKVKVVAEASPEILSKPVVYCIGLLGNKPEGKAFADFLLSSEAQKIFQEYGFTSIKR